MHTSNSSRLCVFALLAAAAAGAPARAQCTPEWLTGFESNGLDATAYALAVYDDGTGPALYVGGSFKKAGAVNVGCIAKWDGKSWSDVGGGVAGSSPAIRALAVYDADGAGGDPPALYAGGFFTSAGGIGASNIAKWDGSAWSALGAGVTGNTGVRAMLAHGGVLYVGGSFTKAGGVSANYISQWNGTGWSWPGGGSNGLAGGAHAMAAYKGSLIVGGAFPTAGMNLDAHFVARWDGANWFDLAKGTSTTVNALAVYDDGAGEELYAGGAFLKAGGNDASRVARWNGAAWAALGAGVNGEVRALAVHDDGAGGALYVGGDFSTAGGASAQAVARWKGGAWSALGTGMVSPVTSLASFDEDGADKLSARLFAGGSFIKAGGVPSPYIARWGCPDACAPDCDKDGVLDIDDFICFQTNFGLGDMSADCDESGELDIDDFICYQTSFGIGCE